MRFKSRVVQFCSVYILLVPALAWADDNHFLDHLGGTVGASYSLGKMSNSAMDLPSRLLGSWDFEVLPGYQINEHWLVGLDFDFRFARQYTSLANAGGTNLGGNAWTFGLGTKYTFNSRWALQGAFGFVGEYLFSNQTALSSSDHLGGPLSFRLKPQFFPMENLPLSIDLDLRYIRWRTFTVSSTGLSNGTSDWSVGLGMTYHFKQHSHPEVKPVAIAADQVPVPEPKAAEPEPVPLLAATPVPENAAHMEAIQTKLAEVLDVKKTDQGLMVNLKSESFGANSAELSEDSKANIAKAGAVLSQSPNQKIRIEGYSDTSGKKASNLKLSQKRADSVKAVLVQSGVNAQNISSRGYGAAKPIANNKTAEGRKQNRRVEIYIDHGSN